MEFNGAKVPIPPVGGRGVLKVAALGGAAFVALNSFFNVEDGQYGIIFNHFKGFKEKVYPEGTHLMIPFLEKPIIYVAHSQPSWFQRTSTCRDLTMAKVGVRVLTKPVPEKLPIICKTFGKDFNEKILPPIVQDSLKSIVERYNANELVYKREVVAKQIKDMMTLRAGYLGIAVEDVCITSISIGKEPPCGVEAKHVAAKETESAKFISEKAEVDNRIELTIGQIFMGPELWSKIAKDPTTRSYLDQSDFVQMLRDVQRNPSILKMHLSDARMIQVLNLMLNIKIQWPEASETLPSSQLQQQMLLPEMKSREVEPVPQPVSMDLTDEEAQERKAAAQKEKEAGKAAYKKKDFDTAIRLYTKAMELDDEDISLLTNRAAVYIEMGKYDECIKDCDKAVEWGREFHADFKMISRALTRKGTALVKLAKTSKDYDIAIETFQKALTEHRNPNTLKKLNEAESAKKELEQLEYYDPKIADEEREKGNEFFKEQKYPEGIKQHTEALRRNPKDPRNKAMQDPDIQKILTDPIMRQLRHGWMFAAERPQLHTSIFSQAKKGEEFTFIKPHCERTSAAASSAVPAPTDPAHAAAPSRTCPTTPDLAT